MRFLTLGHERAALLHLPVVPERERNGQDETAEEEAAAAAEATAGTRFSAVLSFISVTEILLLFCVDLWIK